MVGSSAQSLSFSSWTTPGATCVSSVLREADAGKDEKKWGGGWGSWGRLGEHSACSIGLSLGEGGGKRGRLVEASQSAVKF